jgi:hypothetical protein
LSRRAVVTLGLTTAAGKLWSSWTRNREADDALRNQAAFTDTDDSRTGPSRFRNLSERRQHTSVVALASPAFRNWAPRSSVGVPLYRRARQSRQRRGNVAPLCAF